MNIKSLCIIPLILTLSYSSNLKAAMSDEQISQEVANLFLSVKLVLAESQPVINDPNIEDKGLSSEVIIEKAKTKYLQMTGKNFKFSDDPKLKQIQEDLIAATQIVMNKAQPLINMKGVGFKGFITAVFAKNLAREFSNRSSVVTFKFTAPESVLRSQENMPDSWEKQIFKNRFMSSSWQKEKAYFETVGTDFRWMLPLYHEQGCMACHGSPKGELDITGFKKEGASVGQLAGAFSIVLNNK